jgi:Pin2-interacting protein X1
MKMLQKMGWKEGKGLGANEDGSTENIRVIQKDNQLGVGASKRTIDNWLEHTDAFNQVLASLNQSIVGSDISSTQLPVSSVDKSTIQKREIKLHGRLAHRSKFVQAKNLAMSDARHLQDILGLKDSSSNSKHVSAEQQQLVDMQTTSTVSVQDYFAQKLALLKAGQTSEPKNRIDDDDDVIKERRGGLGCLVDEEGRQTTVEISGQLKRKRDDAEISMTADIKKKKHSLNEELKKDKSDKQKSKKEKSDKQKSKKEKSGKQKSKKDKTKQGKTKKEKSTQKRK